MDGGRDGGSIARSLPSTAYSGGIFACGYKIESSLDLPPSSVNNPEETSLVHSKRVKVWSQWNIRWDNGIVILPADCTIMFSLKFRGWDDLGLLRSS